VESEEQVRDCLTRRERKLIEQFAQGKTNRQVAIACGLGFEFAESCLADIMRRLNLRTSTDLVRYVVRTQPFGD
jgi:FixJ family two-component response regulator